jgi:hypothetical protein
MGRLRNPFKILVRKPEGKKPFGRPRLTREHNIRMDLREIGGRVWTGCIWLRLGISGGRL